jgi:hypothetical protein
LTASFFGFLQPIGGFFTGFNQYITKFVANILDREITTFVGTFICVFSIGCIIIFLCEKNYKYCANKKTDTKKNWRSSSAKRKIKSYFN